jgi:tetratricopeptide (TPR) repeat protein
MLLSNGLNGPPCGTPASVFSNFWPTTTPAFRYLCTSEITRPSFTVLDSISINLLWLTVSKNFAAMAGSGQSEKASKYLNEYISGNTERNDRNVANAWYYLGITEKNKNNQTAAKGHFNNALRINPDHKEAQQALKELN